MATWRKLYVKTTESLDINDMPDDFTRLLWVTLPLGLDAEGRGLDYAAWVRSKVMPLREDVTAEMIEAALVWYEERGMIERYRQNGRRYFWIPTWRSYQGDTKRETPSNFPGPTPALLTQDACNSHVTVTQDACNGHVKLTQESRLDVDIDVDIDVEVDSESSAKPDETTLTPSQGLFQALADLCQISTDAKIITKAQRGQLNAEAKRLREADIDGFGIEAFGRWWYANDWRGKKKQAPGPSQVRSEWGKFQAAQNEKQRATDPQRFISGKYADRILS